MVKVKRALISVSDKTGIAEFAKGLDALGVEILSTGGTAKLIKDTGVSVRSVSDFTGSPEMLGGRVKTLHPRIHGALLARRDNPEHMRQVKEQNIELIDLVVVNLYPFEDTVRKQGVSLEDAIENIDIGGPSMLRSAAKNSQSVAVVSNPETYKDILKELKENDSTLSDKTLAGLGAAVFKLTAHYDKAIYSFLSGKCGEKKDIFPQVLEENYEKVQQLRYGENPHQKAAFYKEQGAAHGIPRARQVHGKELSFNNILDLSAAWEIVEEFDQPAASVIKHTNPCGMASSNSLCQAYKDALECDPLSAFGSIVGLNKKVDTDTAGAVASADFVECIIAPGYDKGALEILTQKKNLRILELPGPQDKRIGFDLKKVLGGLLLQDRDVARLKQNELKIATRKKPTEGELKSLLFAWKVVKHVKSNAIVLVQGTKTVGVGAGQMSRVDSVIIAVRKAGTKVKGSVLASDAFFPKTDAIETAAREGVRAVIQPGGSMRDDEVIKAADKHGIAMVFTGTRHFKH